MVGRVLTNRNVVKRDGGEYMLVGYENLAPDQVQRLKAASKAKLSEYLARRGDAIWKHRRRAPATSAAPCAMRFSKMPTFVASCAGLPRTSAP